MKYIETETYGGINRVLIGGTQDYLKHVRHKAATGFETMRCTDIYSSGDLHSLLQTTPATLIQAFGEFDDFERNILTEHGIKVLDYK